MYRFLLTTLFTTFIACGVYLFYTPFQAYYEPGFPILMYHDINDRPGRFNVSPAHFRSHLEKLHKAGYTTARLEDILNHDPSLENKKVVVLRFDDSRKSHFRYIKDKEGNLMIDPQCAVGILLDFYKENPEFGCHALFCVIATEEFHQPSYARKKLNFLLSHAMELCNHTYDHSHLASAQPEDIDRAFGRAQAHWEKLLGDNAQKIKFIALPYGALPSSKSAQEQLKRFTWQQKEYNPRAVLCAGRFYNKPCPWPTSTRFNPYAVPSIEVTDSNFDEIMHMLERKPYRSFVARLIHSLYTK